MWRVKAARKAAAVSPSYTRWSAATQAGRQAGRVGWRAGGGQRYEQRPGRCALLALGGSRAQRARPRSLLSQGPHSPDSDTVICVLAAGRPSCMNDTRRAPPTAMMQACKEGGTRKEVLRARGQAGPCGALQPCHNTRWLDADAVPRTHPHTPCWRASQQPQQSQQPQRSQRTCGGLTMA